MGETGSGKTVTAKTILGLLPETATSAGAVLLTGKDGRTSVDVVPLSKAQLRQVRGRDVAMVFQEPSTALNPVYTVGWQIAEGLRAHGRYTQAAGTREGRSTSSAGSASPTRRRGSTTTRTSSPAGRSSAWSSPWRSCSNPGLIVADEPTTALDVTVQAEILDLLRRCRDEFGTAIVLITHNMGVVADLADRVAVMYQGKIVEEADAVHAVRRAAGRLHQAAAGRRAARRARARCSTAERAAARAADWAGATAPVVDAHGPADRLSRPARPRRTSSPWTG